MNPNKKPYMLALASLFLLMGMWARIEIVAEQAKFLANDGAVGDSFGFDVALDGDTALVGALRDDNAGGIDAGSAYIFVRSRNRWHQQAKLIAADGAADDTFGGKVALSGDTAVIGAAFDDYKGVNSGSAYVFTRSGSIWSQQAKLSAADTTDGDAFGQSIALSGDIVVVGAPKDDDNGSNSGAVYVFSRSGKDWLQQAKLTAPDGAAGDVFGISVAMSGDTIVIGADLNDEKALNAGAVYVFVRSGDGWHQQAKLMASDGAETDIFGVRVALSGDTALISARRDDDDVMGIDAGSAYIFTRNGTIWHQQAKLTASDGAADDRFGRSVALSGNTAVIGAMFQDDMGDNSGAIYIFTRSGNTWREQSKLLATDGSAEDALGWSIALSGETMFVGAARDDDETGSAYIFNFKQKDSMARE